MDFACSISPNYVWGWKNGVRLMINDGCRLASVTWPSYNFISKYYYVVSYSVLSRILQSLLRGFQFCLKNYEQLVSGGMIFAFPCTFLKNRIVKQSKLSESWSSFYDYLIGADFLPGTMHCLMAKMLSWSSTNFIYHSSVLVGTIVVHGMTDVNVLS